MPGLRNKNNPCSLLAELFRVGAGNDHLDVINESVGKAEIAAQAKTQAEAIYAAEQARLSDEASEWINSKEGQRVIELMS